jgi:hypothetical protein
MTRRVGFVGLLIACCAIVFSISAAAATIWDNGALSGQVGSRDIGSTALIQTWDSFTVSGAPVKINVVTFGAWLDQGDSLLLVNLDIYTQPDNGGSFVFGTLASTAQSNCSTNSLNAFVCDETVDLHGAGPTLVAGTYWLRLYNGATQGGSTTAGWDINQGTGCTSPGCPSQAVDKTGGPIPSESFTIYSDVGLQPAPESGSLVLLGAGVMGLVGAVRRKVR